MSDSGTLWTAACQAPLSMGFSRQEYWSGLPLFSPGDLPHPGIEPGSPVTPAFHVDQMVKSLPAVLETQFQFLSQEDTLEEDTGNPLHCSHQENFMDREQATVHGVTKIWTQLSD